MTKGLLFAAFNFRSAREDEFHDWYDLEHVPERLRVPGFLNAQRWIAEDDPNVAVATYDLDSVEVPASSPYRAVSDNPSAWTRRVTGMSERIMRFVGEQLVPGDLIAADGAGALLVASMNVASEAEAEFNTWYNTEHLPQLASVPGVLTARRFRASDTASPRRYLALYDLRDGGVSRSSDWSRAANTPWTERMRPHFRDMLLLRLNRYQRKAA